MPILKKQKGILYLLRHSPFQDCFFVIVVENLGFNLELFSCVLKTSLLVHLFIYLF